jgi:antitoxin MazE
MRAPVVRIGDGRGVLIPPSILAVCEIDAAVPISVIDERIVLSAPRRVRAGWEETAQEMVGAGGDVLLARVTPTSFHED